MERTTNGQDATIPGTISVISGNVERLGDFIYPRPSQRERVAPERRVRVFVD
jgi:hypothetical protein